MNLGELLSVLWRRKLIVLAATILAVAAAVGALKVVTKQYESSTTLALSPVDAQNGLVLFGILDAVVPVYADAATSRTTRELARPKSKLPLGSVTVDTFSGTPIIRVKSRDASPYVARDTAEAVTQGLLQRVHRGEIGLKSVRLDELDKANLPTVAVFPRTRLTLIVALFLGLCLGIGIALLRETLATKVETPEDLERIAGASVFAEIPTEPAVARVRSPEEFATDTRLRAVQEALRDLRTNLLFAEGSLRSIVLASPQGSHGKTTISFGLATTLARAGTRTLLVDGDLRRGRLAELLEIPRTPGLMEVLMGTPVEEVIRHTELDTLDVITGGQRGIDPAEFLTNEFAGILSQLTSMYETVVIDGTPLVPVSDSRIMARFADAILVVASSGAATRRQVRTAVERLELIQLRPTAMVLNNYSAPGSTGYYGPPEESRRGRRARQRTG